MVCGDLEREEALALVGVVKAASNILGVLGEALYVHPDDEHARCPTLVLEAGDDCTELFVPELTLQPAVTWNQCELHFERHVRRGRVLEAIYQAVRARSVKNLVLNFGEHTFTFLLYRCALGTRASFDLLDVNRPPCIHKELI